MTTIKSYTDLSQSKKLAEFLSLESADMCYLSDESLFPKVNYNGMVFFNSEEEKPSTIIPCWSLAALLSVLPTIDDDEFEPQLHRSLDKYRCTYEGKEDSSGLWRVADNPVDACYEMIIKLHELKML